MEPQNLDINQEEPKAKLDTGALLLLGSGLLVTAFVGVTVLVTYFSDSDKPIAQTSSALLPKPSLAPFNELSLEAKAVYVYDVAQNRTLFSKNDETQLPLASVTKLMTAIVAAESLPYDAIVTVDEAALALEGDSGLYVKERWRAQDLLDYMLMVSSNDSAYVLASAAGALEEGSLAPSPHQQFVARMNQKAAELNLEQTYFLNETGLDTTEAISGGYGSANDMAHLMAYAITQTPRAVDATNRALSVFSSLDNIIHEAENTNEIIPAIPGLIASKTGYTELAGGNLVVAFDIGINRPIVVAVLGSTREGRFNDVEKLVAATFQAFQEAK